MRFVYNILFGVFFALSAPFYFLKMWRRGDWKPGFQERFGKYGARTKQAITNRHVLWMHAVSVGEVNVCTHLIRAIEPRIPNIKIVVSTTTSTGMGELRKKLPTHVEKIYYPIDRRKWAERALRTIGPEAIVLVEAEIWPNFLWRAMDKNIPVFLVNARLSERSFRGYRRFGLLFRPLFRSFAGVGAQNEADKQRLVRLGCRPDAVRIVGSLKYDAAVLHERPLASPAVLLKQLGVADGSPIIIGGSTHAGEEAILADVFKRLKKTFPDLFLVVVPRHHERGKEAGEALRSAGLKFVYRTEISGAARYKPGEIECLLVNTTGELRYFYEEATIIFVGKSLAGEGGQNPIEPAALAKPIVFGPNMQNFREIAAAFAKGRGAIQVQDANELEAALARLLSNPAEREELGRNARAVVQENLGSMERTVEMIVQHFAGSEIHVAGRK